MLDEKVVTAVAIGNFKAISEQPSMLSNLAYSNAVSTNNLGQQNAVSNQQAGNQLGVSLMAKATKTVSDLDPLAARSAVDVLTNNELAQTIADLKATVEAFANPGKGHKPIKWSSLVAKEGPVVFKPPVPPIFIPGAFAREDIKVELTEAGVTITVSEH